MANDVHQSWRKLRLCRLTPKWKDSVLNSTRHMYNAIGILIHMHYMGLLPFQRCRKFRVGGPGSVPIFFTDLCSSQSCEQENLSFWGHWPRTWKYGESLFHAYMWHSEENTLDVKKNNYDLVAFKDKGKEFKWENNFDMTRICVGVVINSKWKQSSFKIKAGLLLLLK